VSQWWKQQGLPSRKAMSHSSTKWTAKVRRWETCRACGTLFKVTNTTLLNRRAGHIKYRVCGQRCGCALRGQPADDFTGDV
jgi:hypothetical protein